MSWPPRHLPFSGKYVVAVIPAHNEEQRIRAAIHGLRAQEREPDSIVVVADNCTDQTASIAREEGVQVLETQGNTDRKAGALNQALSVILPPLAPDDFVLLQDADTVLSPTFLSTALEEIDAPEVGAVGGIFYGEEGGGILGALQRVEFRRYAREVARRGHRADVLTGTGTLFKVETLARVKDLRASGTIGGGKGYYSVASVTEDDEITKAVRTLGLRTVSPAGCEVVTEVMTTLPKLWHQRVRWQRGAIENIRDYGWTSVTRPYIGRQVLRSLCVLMTLLFTGVFTYLLYSGNFAIDYFWLCITAIFVAERVITAVGASWRLRVMASLLVVEFLYDLFQNAAYLRGIWDAAIRSKPNWRTT